MSINHGHLNQLLLNAMYKTYTWYNEIQYRMTKRVIALRITDSVIDEIRNLSKALNMSMSDVIRLSLIHI